MWEKIIAGAVIAWAWVQIWWARIAPVLEPIVKEAEQLALDGKIDLADRKKLVMDTIAILEKQGAIKVGFFTRLIISRIVDIIAKRLPDFVVSQTVAKVMDKEIK